MRILFALSLGSALLFSSAQALASAAVVLKEVSVTNEVRMDAKAVRRTLHEEIVRVNGRMTVTKRAADVSMTVARRPSEGGFELIVSAACRDARQGNLIGVLEGRARTIVTKKSGASEEALLEAAAKGALSQLSAMLR